MSHQPSRERLWRFVLLANVSAYAALYMSQVPVFPYLIKQLGFEGSREYAITQTIFNAVQFVGGLLCGPFVDRFGGHMLLQVSFISSILCYGMTASAQSMWLLYLSRVFTVMQHAILAARTIVTNSSADSERAKLLGYVGVAYGVGFALGPALGGLQSDVSLRLPAVTATVGSLLSWLCVWLLIPADYGKSPQQDKDKTQQTQRQAVAPWKIGWQPLVKAASHPGVLSLVFIKAASTLAMTLFTSIFTLLLQQQYGLGSKHNGMVLSLVGLLTIASQALIVDAASKRLGSARAVTLCSWMLLATYACLAASSRLWQLLVLLAPMCVAGSVLATINTAQLTQAVPSDLSGSILAIDMSLGSAVRMASPALGTWLLTQHGAVGLGSTSAGIIGIMLALMHAGVVRSGGGAAGGGGGGEQHTKTR